MTPVFGSLAEGASPVPGAEAIATLLERPGLRIERIASHRAASPRGFWYDQAAEEFVLLARGTARLEFEDAARDLAAGDWVVLPAHCRHRVAATSADALWLAIHLTPAASPPSAPATP